MKLITCKQGDCTYYATPRGSIRLWRNSTTAKAVAKRFNGTASRVEREFKFPQRRIETWWVVILKRDGEPLAFDYSG